MLIAGNWKMHRGRRRRRAFCRDLRERLASLDGVDVAVCPPFVSLGAAVQALAGTDIAVAAQNVHWEEQGAFTGEISPAMLSSSACTGPSSATRSGGSCSARPTRASPGAPRLHWTPGSG